MERTEFKSHISEKFNRSLEDLFNHVMEMGGLVEAQLSKASEAIKCENKSLAKEVKHIDNVVNREEYEIDRIAANVLARQQPAASDLRLIVSAIRMGVDLERIGDESVNVAKLAIKMAKVDDVPCETLPGYKELLDMVAINIDMLKKVFSGLGALDLTPMADVIESEELVSELSKKAWKKIQTSLNTEHDQNAEHAMHMINSVRAAERIAAHTVNVVESIVYLINGRNYKNIDSKKFAEFLSKID